MKNNDANTPNDSRIFLSFSRNATIGWGSGILALLVLFFVLGTLVGRSMIRVDLGQDGLFLEISGIREAENRLGLSEMESIPEEASDFAFYKELNQDAAKEKTPERSNPSEKNKSVVKRKKEIVTPVVAEKPPAQRVVASKPEPSKPVAAAPAKTDTVPDNLSPDIYKYTIQAGSFRSSEDADTMVSKLNRLGYQAYWVKGLVRDKEIWFRVRIGAFKDRMDADSSLGRLKRDNIDAFLVKR